MPQLQAIAALCQSGLDHLVSEHLDAAERDFQAVIAREPHHIQGLFALGVIAWRQGRNPDALGYAQRVVAIAPQPPGNHLLLARVLRDLGQFQNAANAFRTALRRTPTDNTVRLELALVLTDAGLLEDAMHCYRTALRHDPALAAAHYNLGNVLVRLGCFIDAIASYEAALALQPSPDTENNLADALWRTGRANESERAYRSLIDRHPAMVDAQYNLGTILFRTERFAAAVDQFRLVLTLQPDHLDALNNLGSALVEAGAYTDAEACLRQAVQRQPGAPRPLSNWGAALRELGQTGAAEACFVEALRLEPGHIEARNNLATTLLQTGRLREGWQHYEARWQTRTMPPRPFSQPRWNGEPLGDGVLLIHAEQGLGDTLQFCRYLPMAAKITRVVLEVQKPLARLMTLSFPELEQIIVRDDPLPAFARHCPMLTLPLIFDTTLETIPAEIPYFTADPTETSHWRSRLAALPGLRVGVVWRGNQLFAEGRRKRDMDPSHLAQLADIPGLSFVSLQKDLPPEAQAEAAAVLPMTDWTAELDDFAQTAALVAGLDLVIGVDTSTLHLAGALGRPTWLVNRFDPCWRWMRDREDSPWYPNHRQFRPTAIDGWSGVMNRIRSALISASQGQGLPLRGHSNCPKPDNRNLWPLRPWTPPKDSRPLET